MQSEAGGLRQTPHGSRTIVVLGALSAIAVAAEKLWAREHAHLVLLARDATRVRQLEEDLESRGATTSSIIGDLVELDQKATLRAIAQQIGTIDVVLLAYGVLGDQKTAEMDPVEIQKIMATNLQSASAWCLAAAELFEKQGCGKLIVLGSVAGDRGRQSNYVYGACKGALAILTQGIAHRLARSGASATLIKIGLVDTPMTAALPKSLPLWVAPDVVARTIIKVAGASSRSTIYAPRFWRWIMWAVRSIPSPIMHRTRL